VRLFVHQLRAEQVLFWRSREAAFFIFIFPLILFVLLASVYNGTFLGRPDSWAVFAGIVAYGGANTGFAGLALLLIARRELGILKRIRSTPLPSATYLAAAVTSMVVVFLLQVSLLWLLGKALEDLPFPDRLGSFLFVILLGCLSFAGLGLAATSLIRSVEGSSGAINAILLPMAFLSGGFGPTVDYPTVLQKIGDVLPLTYFVELMYTVYLRQRSAWTHPGAIAVLVAWGAAGALLAARRFRWEPVEG
jgi:ABC-2 type transport system permease protein